MKPVSLVARAVSGASSSTRGHTRGTRARCPRARRVGRWSSIVAALGKVHPSRPGGDAALSAPRLTSSARPGQASQCPRGPALGRSRRWAPRPARRAGRRPATVSPPWPGASLIAPAPARPSARSSCPSSGSAGTGSGSGSGSGGGGGGGGVVLMRPDADQGPSPSSLVARTCTWTTARAAVRARDRGAGAGLVLGAVGPVPGGTFQVLQVVVCRWPAARCSRARSSSPTGCRSCLGSP